MICTQPNLNHLNFGRFSELSCPYWMGVIFRFSLSVDCVSIYSFVSSTPSSSTRVLCVRTRLMSVKQIDVFWKENTNDSQTKYTKNILRETYTEFKDCINVFCCLMVTGHKMLISRIFWFLILDWFLILAKFVKYASFGYDHFGWHI